MPFAFGRAAAEWLPAPTALAVPARTRREVRGAHAGRAGPSARRLYAGTSVRGSRRCFFSVSNTCRVTGFTTWLRT